MKRAFLLAIAAGALMILNQILKSPPATPSSPPARIALTPRLALPPAATKSIPKPSFTPMEQRLEPKPRGNAIEFRIVDGFAVAYGDLILGKPDSSMTAKRGWAEAPAPQFWDRPEIAFNIHPELPNPERVEKAIAYLQEKTPVRFVPFSGQKDVVQFEVGTEHCLSLLGKVGGVQPIRLSANCQWQEVLHEILHTLGFIHEQSRGDRDQYIEILWKNIDQDYQDQFAMVPELFTDAVRGFPFDYQSAMLYSPDSFVLEPGLKNMQSRTDEPIRPVRNGLSEGDIKRVNRMFLGFE